MLRPVLYLLFRLAIQRDSIHSSSLGIFAQDIFQESGVCAFSSPNKLYACISPPENVSHCNGTIFKKKGRS